MINNVCMLMSKPRIDWDMACVVPREMTVKERRGDVIHCLKALLYKLGPLTFVNDVIVRKTTDLQAEAMSFMGLNA